MNPALLVVAVLLWILFVATWVAPALLIFGGICYLAYRVIRHVN